LSESPTSGVRGLDGGDLRAVAEPRRGTGVMTEEKQLNLADYVHDLEAERRKRRPKGDRDNRAYIVFATDPERVGEEDYKLVFATEARTEAEAQAKVRPLVGSNRRVAAYLASGKYGEQLPEARWVA